MVPERQRDGGGAGRSWEGGKDYLACTDASDDAMVADSAAKRRRVGEHDEYVWQLYGEKELLPHGAYTRQYFRCVSAGDATCPARAVLERVSSHVRLLRAAAHSHRSRAPGPLRDPAPIPACHVAPAPGPPPVCHVAPALGPPPVCHVAPAPGPLSACHVAPPGSHDSASLTSPAAMQREFEEMAAALTSASGRAAMAAAMAGGLLRGGDDFWASRFLQLLIKKEAELGSPADMAAACSSDLSSLTGSGGSPPLAGEREREREREERAERERGRESSLSRAAAGPLEGPPSERRSSSRNSTSEEASALVLRTPFGGCSLWGGEEERWRRKEGERGEEERAVQNSMGGEGEGRPRKVEATKGKGRRNFWEREVGGGELHARTFFRSVSATDDSCAAPALSEASFFQSNDKTSSPISVRTLHGGHRIGQGSSAFVAVRPTRKVVSREERTVGPTEANFWVGKELHSSGSHGGLQQGEKGGGQGELSQTSSYLSSMSHEAEVEGGKRKREVEGEGERERGGWGAAVGEDSTLPLWEWRKEHDKWSHYVNPSMGSEVSCELRL